MSSSGVPECCENDEQKRSLSTEEPISDAESVSCSIGTSSLCIGVAGEGPGDWLARTGSWPETGRRRSQILPLFRNLSKSMNCLRRAMKGVSDSDSLVQESDSGLQPENCSPLRIETADS
jgi:hypothetical protein